MAWLVGCPHPPLIMLSGDPLLPPLAVTIWLIRRMTGMSWLWWLSIDGYNSKVS